jgi:hypothetical protein
MTDRALNDVERAVVGRLLEASFAGVNELRAQLAVARVIHEAAEPGDPSIEFAVPKSLPKALVVRRIPVEASFRDLDGVVGHVLLHVLDGYADELEVYKEDSSDVLGPVRPEMLKIEVL